MRIFIALLVLLSLFGCGGGGGGGGGGLVGSADPATLTLSGVAAQGAGINGRIFLMDSAGHAHYVDTTDGPFQFKLADISLPVLLKAEWSDAAGMHRLYSFASAGGVANVTPLTHVAVTHAAGALALDALYAAPGPAAFAALQAALPAAMASMQADLQALMTRYAVTAANPITLRFAADHTGMDALLDGIVMSATAGGVSLYDKATGALLLAPPVPSPAPMPVTAGLSLTGTLQATGFDAAVNSNGQGMMAWTEAVGGHNVLKVRLMNGIDPGTTLSTAGDAGSPRLLFDGSGNALMVWTQCSNGSSSVWVSRLRANSAGWAPAQQLSPALAGSARQPDLAVDQAGNALVVWQQSDGRSYHADGWAAYYAADRDSWSSAALVSDGVNNAYGLRVALNPAGQGLLAWEQERGDGSAIDAQPVDVWVRQVGTAGSWGTGSIVSASGGHADTAYVYGRLALAVNAAGNAAVLWSRRLLPSLPMVVQAALFQPSGGWQPATTITLDTNEDSHEPAVALDAAGNALAVWQQQTAYGAYGGSNHYVAGVGWGTAGHFVDSKLGDMIGPGLAMDGAGKATVVWYRWSAQNAVDVMVNHCQAGGLWGTAQVFSPVGTESTLTREQPRVASNARGQSLVVWGADTGAVASWL